MTSAESSTPKKSSVSAWITYDTANTIFSFNILSAYFPVWLSQDLALRDSVFALGNSVSMAIMLFLAPPLGAVSDRARRRIPFLVASTVVCVAFTLPLGFVAWPISITFFVLANLGFQGGLVFYDALLPAVSTAQNRGRVGALGVGLGYIGSFIGLGLGALILQGHEERDAWVFASTGMAFLVLAMPAFFLVKEPVVERARLGWLQIREAVAQSVAGLGRLFRGREDPKLSRFLLGRVFYTEAANTMIAFMGVYALHEANLSDAGVRLVLFFGIAGAVLASPAWGVLVDRRGPASTLMAVLGVWMVGLLLVIAVPVVPLAPAMFFPAAFVLGGALGGTWSADRPLMVLLAPPQRLGEFYGIYAMVGRFSAVVGPLIWALVVDGLELGRPAAVAALAVFMVAAIFVLRPLAKALAAREPVLPAGAA